MDGVIVEQLLDGSKVCFFGGVSVNLNVLQKVELSGHDHDM